MTAILSGSLRHFSIELLVRFLLAQQIRGRLRLVGDNSSSEVFLKNGSIVAARHLAVDSKTTNDDPAEQILVDLLLRVEGSFDLFEETETPEGLVIAAIDLERAVAAARVKREKLASADAIVDWKTLVDAAERDGTDITLTAREFRMVMRVKEPRTVEDLSADSDDREAARTLVQSLVERGILRVVPAGMPAFPSSPETVVIATTSPHEIGASANIGEISPDPPSTAPVTSDSAEILTACLTVDDEARTPYPLLTDEYTIGRDAGNSIPIADDSVSSTHARLTRTPAGFELEDLKSRNGTFVNGARIERVLLQDNDSVRIGKIFATYNTATQMNVQETFMGRISKE